MGAVTSSSGRSVAALWAKVWLGRDNTDGAVAIKMLRPELAEDPQLVARSLQERTILTALRHPNVVEVRDLVAEGGNLGIVMELVEGTDLRGVLNARGTLPPAEAVAAVADVLAGLHAAHLGGVVHRDVKPENVLVPTRAGAPLKVTDFGIARLIVDYSKTGSTSLIGTPEYLAPEIATGELPTPRSDVYGAGILLYELLTAVTPFRGGGALTVLRRQAEQLPGRPEGLPDALWAVLGRLLAKKPDDWPATAADARELLLSRMPAVQSMPALPALSTPPPAVMPGTMLVTPHPAATIPAPRAKESKASPSPVRATPPGPVAVPGERYPWWPE